MTTFDRFNELEEEMNLNNECRRDDLLDQHEVDGWEYAFLRGWSQFF